jgi:hypothetical protein
MGVLDVTYNLHSDGIFAGREKRTGMHRTRHGTDSIDTDPAGTYETNLENTRNIPADNTGNLDKNSETPQNLIT